MNSLQYKITDLKMQNILPNFTNANMQFLAHFSETVKVLIIYHISLLQSLCITKYSLFMVLLILDGLCRIISTKICISRHNRA